MDPSFYKLRNQPVVIHSSGLPAPIISYIEEERLWRLEESYSYRHAGHRITVPAEFKFDLASVPRLFWFLIAPFELSIAAPLIHDFLYEHKGDPPTGSIAPPKTFSRKEADRIFREIMEKEAVAGWRRFFAYWAVRCFGWLAWFF
jgi:hypothetical protein